MAPILVPIDPTLKPDQVAVVVSKIVEKAQAGDVVHLLVVTYKEKADKEVAEAYYIPTLDEKKIALCITKAAATISAGLIIMWDHHENFLKSLVIGNTTKIVQKESFIPVEIVNPK